MSTYYRVMSGRNTTSPVSHRFVVVLVILTIAASVVIDASVVLNSILSPAGIASVVAIVGGLAIRRLMALTPWYLLTVALALDVLLPVLHGAWAFAVVWTQYSLVGSACLTAIFQVKVELTRRRDPEEGSLVAWGSAMVALSFLIIAIVNR